MGAIATSIGGKTSGPADCSGRSFGEPETDEERLKLPSRDLLALSFAAVMSSSGVMSRIPEIEFERWKDLSLMTIPGSKPDSCKLAATVAAKSISLAGDFESDRTGDAKPS
jgi:hypothetical protein